MADKKISALTASTTPLAGTEVLPIVQSGTSKQVSVANLTAGRAVAALSYASTSGFNLNSSFTSANNYVGCDNTAGNAATLWFRKGRDIGTGSVDGVGLDSLGTSGVVPFIVRGQPVYINDGTATNKFENGNLVIGTSGKGIDFSATPGTGTSELLADYEEGLCTLGIAFGGGTTGITYGGRPISYVKVGSLVTVIGYIGLSNKGSSTGSATITGLPFTTGSSANGGFAAVTLSAANLSFVGQYSGYTAASGTTVNLYQTAATGALSALTDVNFANNTEIEFCIHYRSV